MRRLLFVSLMIGLTLFCGACAKGGENSSEKQKAGSSMQEGSTEKAGTGVTNGLKRQKLENFQSKTIGEAFDSYTYLVNKEWKEKPLPGKAIEIAFIGWFPSKDSDGKIPEDGVIARGLEVKFDVTMNGLCFVKMIWRLEAKSGNQITALQLDDTADILTKIYANKEIKL